METGSPDLRAAGARWAIAAALLEVPNVTHPRSRMSCRSSLPQNADQFLNAHAGAKSGVAREIAPGEITAERVREELERVLGDQSTTPA